MEFKGTKANWKLNCQYGSWLIQDEESYQEGLRTCLAEVYYFHDGEDTAEANALLISKAPEMLGMLNECKLQLEYLNEKFTETGTTNSLLSKIESLIKQATDL